MARDGATLAFGFGDTYRLALRRAFAKALGEHVPLEAARGYADRGDLSLGARVARDFAANAGRVDRAFTELQTWLDSHTFSAVPDAPAAPCTAPSSGTKTKAT